MYIYKQRIYECCISSENQSQIIIGSSNKLPSPDLSATGGKSSDSWGYQTKSTRIDDSGITSRSYSNLKM